MDADELVRALQALNVATSVQTVSDTRCVLNIENGISFAGVDGQISYRRKGSLAKLCAKFYASNISDEQIATIQLVKSDSCRIHAVRKGNDASIKIISVNSLQTDLNEQVSVLCAFSTQVLTIMLPSTPCTTLEFSEVLRFTPTEAAPHYVKTGNSSGVSSVIIEGSQADCAAFQQQIPPVLQPYFMWELQPGDAFNGIMCDMYPERDGRPGPMEWIMSLFDKGIAFVSFPCKYLYYHSPVSDFRLLPAPLHLSDFQLTHVSPRDTYFCKVAKEMAVFSAERQNPCSVPLVDTQILSQILPIDRLPMDKFQEQNLSKCVVIGKGGFGNILLNEMRIASQKVQVAMKVIKSEKLGKASNIDALIQEYKIMRACNHSNIIKVFGYTLYQDTLVIVMEYCEKKTLYRYVLDNKLQMQEKIKLMLQIANGIVFLHSKSICHLDLKPQNILIDSQGVAKLSDFGLSKSVTAKKLSGKTGYTLLYSAPEQIEGQEPGLDADIWAFGNLMYFVCFQKGPIDYVKNPSDNVHSFATKKLVLSELKEKMRKPLIPDSSEGLPICHEFEIRYPKLVHLMRNCWVLDQTLRIKAIKALKTLEKLLEPASL